MFSRKVIFLTSFVGFAIFVIIGLSGHYSDGFVNRVSKVGLTAFQINQKLKANHGLSEDCNGETLLPTSCKTHDEPEILVWGDSFAMHLVQGILESNPHVKIIQMTKSNCGPFFGVAPIFPNSEYSINWGEGCLEFAEKVRVWLKQNQSVKYVVLSSPFNQYLSGTKLLFRNGSLVPASTKLATQEFEETLSELKQMEVTPVIFSPPPSNGIDLGRCLAKAEWNGLSYTNCDFSEADILKGRLSVYEFLESFRNKYQVVSLESIICNSGQCNSHIDKTYLYRDSGHLSYEGAAILGKKYDFYGTITGK
jgi:hypothetical protein